MIEYMVGEKGFVLMAKRSLIYKRLQLFHKIKPLHIKAAVDESATLVNNLNSLSQQCNNIIGTIAEMEKAKADKNGDEIDKILDKLKEQLNDFRTVGKASKIDMVKYLSPMIKG